MNDLTVFLLARIAEDEDCAKGAYRDSVDDNGVCHMTWTDATEAVMFGDTAMVTGLEPSYLSDHIARHDPARVLAECEAKRRWIDLAYQHAATIDGEWGCCHDAETLRRGYHEAVYDWDEDEPIPADCYGLKEAAEFLAPLAAVYAGHPDFRDEWKP